MLHGSHSFNRQLNQSSSCDRLKHVSIALLPSNSNRKESSKMAARRPIDGLWPPSLPLSLSLSLSLSLGSPGSQVREIHPPDEAGSASPSHRLPVSDHRAGDFCFVSFCVSVPHFPFLLALAFLFSLTFLFFFFERHLTDFFRRLSGVN